MRKPLRFTRHALDVITERAIKLHWVELAARDPDWEEVDPMDSAMVRRFRQLPERGNRYLRVACVETPDEIRIISAFLDRGAKRQ